MPGTVKKRPNARRDLRDHFVYIGRSNEAAARRFLQAADQAMARLAEWPEMGGLWESDNPALEGLRCWTISRFRNYVIFYRPTSDGIDVIRVLHGAQDIEPLLEG
jgi:toxin ParE1/3/4